jgi:hypothetical protein
MRSTSAAYAAYALSDQPTSGVGLAGAVRRLVGPGKAVDVGPGQSRDIISELHAGRNVDRNGAGSALDFNLATGEKSTDFAVYCRASTPRRGSSSARRRSASDAAATGSSDNRGTGRTQSWC